MLFKLFLLQMKIQTLFYLIIIYEGTLITQSDTTINVCLRFEAIRLYTFIKEQVGTLVVNI